MRTVTEHDTSVGKRYRVRYRIGGAQSSQTFRKRSDARSFAAVLDGGGVGDALEWLKARDRKATTLTLGAWHEEYVAQLTGVQQRTRDDYRSSFATHLGHLADLPLPMVTRGHVADVINTMDDAGRAPKTIKNVVQHLSSCMSAAAEEGHITRNPCRRLRLPAESEEAHETRFLTHEEFGRLVDATPEHYRHFVIFLVGTGLRWSEATALQVQHVEREAGVVRVRRAWKKVKGGWKIGPPKSAKGRRTVNPATMALAAAVLEMGTRGRDELVFTTVTGKVIRHGNFFTRIWQPACVGAGLGDWREVDGERHWVGPSPHDLRHTHASWLISDGIQLEAIQDQLGHISIETTRKVYGHLLPAVGVAVGKAASAAVDRALLHGPQRALGVVPVALRSDATHTAGADEVHDAEGIAAG